MTTFWFALVPEARYPAPETQGHSMGGDQFGCHCSGQEAAPGVGLCVCNVRKRNLKVVVVEDQPWRTPPWEGSECLGGER